MDVPQLCVGPSDDTVSSSTEASSEHPVTLRIVDRVAEEIKEWGANPLGVGSDMLTRHTFEMNSLPYTDPDDVDHLLATSRAFQIRFKMHTLNVNVRNHFKLSGKTGWTYFPKQHNGDCLMKASLTYRSTEFGHQFPNTKCMSMFCRLKDNESLEDLETWTKSDDCLILVDMMSPHGLVKYREKTPAYCGKYVKIRKVHDNANKKRAREYECNKSKQAPDHQQPDHGEAWAGRKRQKESTPLEQLGVALDQFNRSESLKAAQPQIHGETELKARHAASEVAVVALAKLNPQSLSSKVLMGRKSSK